MTGAHGARTKNRAEAGQRAIIGLKAENFPHTVCETTCVKTEVHSAFHDYIIGSV
jgi:hypothetical protein